MSFINSVAKSMNGIKTIETSELIFTDDNSTLNTSAGITQAQSTGQTAINKSISAIAFNTGTGDLTLTTQSTAIADLSVDLDGRYLTSIPTLDADDIPDLPAGKITSDEFAVARIPNLSAGKITSGTFAIARIPALQYVSLGTSSTSNTDETIFGVKTFDEPPVCSTAPSTDNQLVNRAYVLANGGGSGDAELDGGVANNPQTFTEFNKFANTTEFKNILAKSTDGGVNININMESASGNAFIQTSSNTSAGSGGVNNQILQSGGVGNEIVQGTTANGNEIRQNGTNSLIKTEGSITATSSSSKIGIGESSPSATLETFTVYTGTQNTIPDRTENIPNNTTVRIYLAHQPNTTQSFKYGMIMGVTSLGRGYIQCLSNGNDAPRNLLLNPNPGNYGRVGIGINSSPTERLYVNGNVFVTGIYRRPSDDRLKKNEKLIVNATETLCKLKPQIYDKYHNMDLSGSSFIESGLIAQEIYYNAPELRHLIHLGINTDASGNESTPTPDEMDLSGVDIGSDPDYSSHGWSKENPSTVNLDGFIAYLIKSNQELHERILKLENK